MKSNSDTTLPRRHFLQQLVLLGGVTSTAGLMLEVGNARVLSGQPAQAAPDPATSASTRGYRLTDHIRTYYEKAQV